MFGAGRVGYSRGVKSLAVIAVAAGVFGWVLYANWHEANAVVLAEDAARIRLGETPGVPSDAGGYRFENRGDLLVALPAADGMRWFATSDGGVSVWEFDTVRHRVPRNGPDLAALGRFLALPADRRGAPPLGWEPARADG